jgi:hypothetical protein
MVYDWPIGVEGFTPTQFEFGGNPATLAEESVLNGGVQTSNVPGKRWTLAMTLPNGAVKDGVRAAVEGFLDRLNGQEHSVNFWHLQRYGVGGWGYPKGSINQAGVTVKTNAAQFALSLTLTGCGAGGVFEAGDLFSVNGQLIMCPVRTVADGSGDLVVPVSGGLRAAALATAAVTLVRPTAKFMLASPQWRSGYAPGRAEDLALDWIERF